jgi:polyhydroxybutyrate depolymerase
MKRWVLRLGIVLLVLAGSGVAVQACVRGDPPPDWGPTSGQLTSGTLSHGGRERSFLYLAPKGDGLHPLVLALHGRTGNGLSQERLSGFSKVAAREGFIVVFPDGYSQSWHDARDYGPAADEKIDDVAFLVALKDEFVAKHQADPKRVYAAGISNGGMMALTLACRASEHFTAIAAVAGLWPQGEPCSPKSPLSVALVMGTNDPLVPFGGGEVSRSHGVVRSAKDTALLLARANGCAGEPDRRSLPNADVNDDMLTEVESFTGCPPGIEVRSYTVENGGHTWPGGWQYLAPRWVGKTTRDWSASEEIWAFFKDKTR